MPSSRDTKRRQKLAERAKRRQQLDRKKKHQFCEQVIDELSEGGTKQLYLSKVKISDLPKVAAEIAAKGGKLIAF